MIINNEGRTASLPVLQKLLAAQADRSSRTTPETTKTVKHRRKNKCRNGEYFFGGSIQVSHSHPSFCDRFYVDQIHSVDVRLLNVVVQFRSVSLLVAADSDLALCETIN